MMLQGASQTINNKPQPIWMVEISKTEHQPHGVAINPTFKKTFNLFFERGYRAFAVDVSMREITESDVDEIAAGKFELDVHNYIFC